MAGRNAKRIRKLKKSHTWIWLIVFALLIILSCILVALFVSVYTSSFVTGKIDAEQKTVRNMADIYESCLRDGNDPSQVLDVFGRDYLILDAAGNVVVPSSSDTIVIPDGSDESYDGFDYTLLNVSALIYDAHIYLDREAPVIGLSDGELVVNVFDILKDIDPYIVPSDRKLFSDVEPERAGLLKKLRLLSGRQEQKLELPLWIGVDINDKNLEFIAKSHITVELYDIILLFIILSGLCLVIMTAFVIMFVNIIAGITRRRKTLRVFLTDPVTQGKNFMYFTYKGEEQLKSFFNRSVRYYVVNLSFVGYRNYCLCHSTLEGERLLGQIYQIIGSYTYKRKEICAHAAESDFALLLRDGEGGYVRDRVQSIIDTVSHITSDHVFVFQAGIEILEPVERASERKKLDLGEVYNIACAARESLGSEDTGIVFFNEKMIEDRRWAETVTEHQQKALDNDEFVVYYQPKYDPRTDELRGAEALIRWQSPEFGFVPPGQMIPIFEKNGFITEIDHYMIAHVARDQKRWLDQGYKCVPVSVNVSRAHFIENDLAEQIRDIVDAEGAPHELIEIELTESAFFDDKRAMINTIEKLKSYGFAVSMDDFGSGYSSLNSLKDMPLDVLKLDAEFFRGENDSKRGEIVVSEAIRLAKSLNMRTVAEGVEVLDQVEFLAAQECDMIQGYFYAKPMPGTDYEIRMKERYKPKGE